MHLTMLNIDTHFFDLKIIFWLNTCIHIIGMLVFLLIVSENRKKKVAASDSCIQHITVYMH